MHVPFKPLAIAALLAAGTAAQAKLTAFDTPSFAGSLAFVAVQTTPTPDSLVVDLGLTLDGGSLQAASSPSGIGAPLDLTTPGLDIVWNFQNNTMTVNGAAYAPATAKNWSGVYSFFQGAATAASTKWAVIGGAAGNYPNYFLTTGAPTPSQLANQTQDLTSNLYVVSTLYTSSNGVQNVAGTTQSTQTLAGWGANAAQGVTNQQSGYVLNNNHLGTAGNWLTNLKWSALVAEGTPSKVYLLEDDLDGATKLAGTFSYSAGRLEFTTPVPEPESYALMAAGLMTIGMLVRRRRAD